MNIKVSLGTLVPRFGIGIRAKLVVTFEPTGLHFQIKTLERELPNTLELEQTF